MPSSRSRRRSSNLTWSRPFIADRAWVAVAAARSYGEASTTVGCSSAGSVATKGPRAAACSCPVGDGATSASRTWRSSRTSPRDRASRSATLPRLSACRTRTSLLGPGRGRAVGTVASLTSSMAPAYPSPSSQNLLPCLAGRGQGYHGVGGPGGSPGRSRPAGGPRGSAEPMPAFGYTMMCEQSRPDQLVRDVQHAEDAGFDFSVTSDHYQPWLEAQGHSGYAWSILGAAAQATTRIPLMTYVTCPTVRYHPAVVAQKAATMQILSQGRFRLGLGAGENLNEHVVGGGWPSVDVRHEMLEEAVEIIRALFEGGHVNRRGTHFDVESARLWDLPDQPPPIGIAVSGEQSCALAGRLADLVIATEPQAGLLDAFDRHGGQDKPRVGQLPVCYDPDRATAVKRAHAQFRWFGG